MTLRSGSDHRRPSERVAVLVAAGTASWEAEAVEALARPVGPVALRKRCLDLPDLLAAAATGAAEVAVVSAHLDGLDAEAFTRLADHGVRALVVTSAGGPRGVAEDPQLRRARLMRMGAAAVLETSDIAAVVAHVLTAAREQPAADPATESTADPAVDPADDRVRGTRTPAAVLAVWSAAGAPGRTTVALGLAAVAASRGTRVTVLDADPAGGAAGQHLAVLDDVSGVLAAARLVNAGRLDLPRLAAVAREVVPRLRLLTGLPRPDRWVELRPQVLAETIEVARALDDLVVVDAGCGLPIGGASDGNGAHQATELTATCLRAADEVVVVATPDPVGLTRLVRGLRELDDHCGPVRTHVVINRMRRSIGFSRGEVEDLVAQASPHARVSFLPEDVATADRALGRGQTLVEVGDSPLVRALTGLVAGLVEVTATAGVALTR